MERILCVLIGYGFGCLQSAYILGKILKGVDIRKYGSGNAGTTNAIRVLGTKIGITTLVLDIVKAVAALVVIALLWGYDQKQLLLWGGIGVVLGHNYPFYMQFKGGKGVAATIGIFLATDIRLLVLAGVPALIILATTKYMSLASLSYMLLLVVVSAIFYIGTPIGLEVLALVIALSISGFWRHRGNIKRLIRGEEVKMGQKVKIEQEDKKKEE
ncbi:MAG: glycerol-3-phosphate 1-O-acyltransferase PlsY [Firmicutes bacterium]|nr:glycerol-3-phosphate 1-O-acyltransferase PlsY [Bacillota bacterium]